MNIENFKSLPMDLQEEVLINFIDLLDTPARDDYMEMYTTYLFEKTQLAEWEI